MNDLRYFSKITVLTNDDKQEKIAEVTPDDMWCDERYTIQLRPVWYDNKELNNK